MWSDGAGAGKAAKKTGKKLGKREKLLGRIDKNEKMWYFCFTVKYRKQI